MYFSLNLLYHNYTVFYIIWLLKFFIDIINNTIMFVCIKTVINYKKTPLVCLTELVQKKGLEPSQAVLTTPSR